jgi:hypothetical protein
MFSGFHISADTSSEGLRLYKRGNTGDATAAIASGSELGYHSFYAWNGSAYGRAAYVLVSSREAFSGSAYGAEYAIFAAPTGSTTPVRAMQVWGTQVICGIGRLQISTAYGGSGANWLQYTESGVADRWGVGTKSGDAALYWNQGLNGAGTDRMSLSSAGLLTVGGGITMTDAGNFAFGTTTGTKIGTATTQKLSLWNATPIVQPSSTGETTGWTTGGGSAATSTDTYTGNTGTKAYTINDIVKHLKNIGALAAS